MGGPSPSTVDAYIILQSFLAPKIQGTTAGTADTSPKSAGLFDTHQIFLLDRDHPLP